MNFVICSAIILLVAFVPLSESGFIKKLVVGVIGGNQNSGKVESEQNYRGNENSQYNRQPEYNRNTTQTYKNTTWHIENEDYLTPNSNESSQHKQRPNSQYGGGGTYDKKSTTSRPYRNTTSDIVHQEYLTQNANESSQHKQRPNSQYGGGGTYDKSTTTRPIGNTNSHFVRERPNGQHNSIGTHDMNPNHMLAFHTNHQESSHHNNGHGIRDRTRTSNLNAPPRQPTQNAGDTSDASDGNAVILRSDAITCHYSNVRDQKVQNRRLRCNDTECRLEKASEKSALWICDDHVKCTIANVDFSEDLGEKKLMECTMDGRNIITVQEKPIKCKPNEKVHKGVCREVFGI